MYLDKFKNTVKPVYNGQSWDPKIEAVVDMWPLFRGRLYYIICNWAFKMVAFVARWPLFISSGLTVYFLLKHRMFPNGRVQRESVLKWIAKV
jgi:hypothetical protein